MKKTTYFIIQIIYSLIITTATWYFTLINVGFDFYGNSDNSFASIILFSGAILYLVVTIIYIIFGIKKVENWKPWILIVSILIIPAMAFIGLLATVYGSELINKILH